MNELSTLPQTKAREAVGFTAREFLQILDTGVFEGKVELVDGVIIKMPPPGLKHSVLNASIATSLASVLTGRSMVVGVDLAILIHDRKLRGIDIAVVRDDAPDTGAVDARYVQLAVEIADSTLTRDLGEKAEDYAGILVPHYWVVDVNARVVNIMQQPEDGNYAVRTVARFGEPIPVPGTGSTIIIS